MRESFTYGSVRGAARKERSLPRLKIDRRQEVGRHDKKLKLVPYAFCAMLFALCFSAEAQQPVGKVPRIGFLANGSPLTHRRRCVSMHFARGFANSVTLMGKTSTSSTVMLGGDLNNYRSWLR